MPQTRAKLRCEILASRPELDALAADWYSLWERDIHATPFQSPQWLLPWSRYVAEGELFAISVYCGPKLVGLLPLYIYAEPANDEAGGSHSQRKLLPVGAGTSDYLGGVFDPEEGSAPVEAALGCVLENRERWDRADLYQLPPTSPLLACARREGWPQVQTEACLRVRLPRNERLGGKLGDNLRYYRRRAERIGALSFSTATRDTALEIFERLVALHTRRWGERGQAGVLASERVRQSHRAALPAMLQQDLARLYSLTLNGRVIAVNYCLLDPPSRSERSFYYYLNGFDPEYAALSPGTLLLGHVAEQAAAEGATYLDMLRGQERYKQLWSAEGRETFGFALSPAIPLQSSRRASAA